MDDQKNANDNPLAENGEAKDSGKAAEDTAAAPAGSDMGSGEGHTHTDSGMGGGESQPQAGDSGQTAGGFQDKTLTCRDCGQEFVWTAGEQEFFAQKGFEHPPSRCTVCRAKYKAARQQFGRVESKITCKNCGRESTVPFVPRDPNTVLCRECFQKERAGGAPR